MNWYFTKLVHQHDDLARVLNRGSALGLELFSVLAHDTAGVTVVWRKDVALKQNVLAMGLDLAETPEEFVDWVAGLLVEPGPDGGPYLIAEGTSIHTIYTQGGQHGGPQKSLDMDLQHCWASGWNEDDIIRARQGLAQELAKRFDTSLNVERTFARLLLVPYIGRLG